MTKTTFGGQQSPDLEPDQGPHSCVFCGATDATVQYTYLSSLARWADLAEEYGIEVDAKYGTVASGEEYVCAQCRSRACAIPRDEAIAQAERLNEAVNELLSELGMSDQERNAAWEKLGQWTIQEGVDYAFEQGGRISEDDAAS